MTDKNTNTEYWYYRQLTKYYHEHYEKYKFNVRWHYSNFNQLIFDNLDLNVTITLTCHEDGHITEMEEPIKD